VPTYNPPRKTQDAVRELNRDYAVPFRGDVERIQALCDAAEARFVEKLVSPTN